MPPRAVKVQASERRWKALRRPCGRLSGLRKTLNVICHISNSYELHQCVSSAIPPPGEIQPSLGSLRRAPRGSSFRRARQPPHRRASLGSFRRVPRNSSFGRTRQPAQRRARIALMRRSPRDSNHFSNAETGCVLAEFSWLTIRLEMTAVTSSRAIEDPPRRRHCCLGCG